MKTHLLAIAFLIGFGGLTGFAPAANALTYDQTQNCVMVYDIAQTAYPNVYIACDGERMMERMVPVGSTVADATAIKTSLYSEFQALVNSAGKKVCTPYDLEGVWWASCLTP